MYNNGCGKLGSLKQVSTKELLDELDVRRQGAREARMRFYAKAWPNMQLCKWSIIWGALGYLLVVGALLLLFDPEFRAYAATDKDIGEKMILLIFGPMIVWIGLASWLYGLKLARLERVREKNAETDILLRGEFL